MSDVAREREAGATTDATAQLRLRKVAAAVRAWTGQLIDLGGRNTLLYYKDLKQGTLDLGPYSGAEPVALDSLLEVARARISTCRCLASGRSTRRSCIFLTSTTASRLRLRICWSCWTRTSSRLMRRLSSSG